MRSTPRNIALALVAVFWLTVAVSPGQTQEKKVEKKQKKTTEVWTDPQDPTLPADFKFQGEYHDASHFGKTVGCQVIALGKGTFQAVVLPGGLPGAGWDTQNKILMAGKLETDKVVFTPAKGKRKYLAQSPDEFSATAKFPPLGQKDYIAAISDSAVDIDKTRRPVMVIETPEGRVIALEKTMRKSPTLAAKPPAGAIVLFDGTNTDEWTRGRLDKVNGILNTDGDNIVSKRKFNNYKMHLEFMLPYRPEARGQGRGNSGFYQVQHYEIQILDSLGLDGKNNECGGIYGKVEPKLNMCLPPLVWQTYDVDFTNAVRDEAGKKIKNARLTLRLNGVVIHDNAEIPGPTGGHRNDPEGTPGPILLQGHGNPLQFRSIWIVEKN